MIGEQWGGRFGWEEGRTVGFGLNCWESLVMQAPEFYSEQKKDVQVGVLVHVWRKRSKVMGEEPEREENGHCVKEEQ